jgi:hypothetical protein
VISCKNVSGSFDENEFARIDMSNAHIENVTKKIILSAQPLSVEMLRIIEKGGILNLIKELAEE